ncbi:hypothetical protein TEA_022208 [Camellia sinensis var. sinensis]|uniref:Malic enzyme NAD-binding domain-containing protein n=1 Tax=Camellia sinensis var. sinensis TaxID=542762 RepID=A0A4S4EBX5_CAMSN|nr:hypothetical protein TEA_022208 [Camellia sinensis var. sinensis]
MEDVGDEYFRELLSRSFFQPSSTGKTSKFVMHDLINDLAQVVARETCFRLEDILKYPKQCKNIKKARHSSYMQENVVVPLDAREANLNDKKGLDVLSMEWSVNSDDSRDGRVETEVLDMLRPHKNLKNLHIKGYLGSRFSTWIGDPLFSNMAGLHLDNCGNCAFLPPLGQLPSLKKLYIKGMSVLKHVSCEFYGQGDVQPFPLLETLSFENMPEWEDWYTFGDHKEVQPFTRVKYLSIIKCPKLLKMLPTDLPCLNNLEIRDCPKLCGMMPKDLHCLNNLEISECPQFLVEGSSISLPSLTSIAMNDVPLTSLEAVLEMRSMDGEVISANAKSTHPNSMISLTIGMIKKLELLPKWVTHGLMELEALKITSCEKLKTLWKNEARVQHSLPAFRRLEIEGCPQLVSLFEGDEDEENEGQHQQQQEEGLSCMVRLEHLRIDNCEKLEKLPRLLHTFTFLRKFSVWNCPSLGSFPEIGFPRTLKKLTIRSCEALQSLFGWITQINDNNLEVLWVENCPSLTCLISCRGGGLPPTLKELRIWWCKKLEALLEEDGMEINCPSLESVWISGCDRLKYLPDALPNNNNLRNLCELNLYGCENLEYIPEGWFHSATNLRQLEISGCKKLKALPHGSQSINYLTSLQELDMNISQWNNNFKKIGLHSLSSLKTLWIEGKEEEHPMGSSFPIDGMLLPTSLTILCIWAFRNLEKLSSKLFQNLASLEQLEIVDCPRLKSLPVQRLPPSLGILWIERCPRLTGKCEKGKGKYWPHLAHIPDVNVLIVRYPHVHFDQFWGNIALGKFMFKTFIVSQFHGDLGLQQPWLEGEEYLSIFEDFQMKWAFERLQQYQKRFCMFNNDIQGTAGVALAGLLGTVRAQDLPLTDFVDQKIVVVGAGSAGLGVFNMVAQGCFKNGRSWSKSSGLITTEQKGVDPAAAPFAKAPWEIEGLGLREGANLVKVVLKAMRESDSPKLAIFAMSNLTVNAECTVVDAFNHGNGKVGHVNQANNMYLFPGIGMGSSSLRCSFDFRWNVASSF